MAQRVLRNIVQRRLYCAQQQAKESQKVITSEIQVGKASNGISLASQENGSSLARVVCAVKAGSRYEDNSQRGVTHCLRAASDNTQKEARAFGLTRNLQQMGANISCTTSRENIVYTLEVPRDNVQHALPYLAGMVAHPSFRPWELSESLGKIDYELLALSEQPDRRLTESLHSVAYREAGLGRSIYAPRFMLGEFCPDLLQEYINTYFTPDRISLSALNVSHDQLMKAATGFDINSPSSSSNQQAKFYSGEKRTASTELLAYTMIAGESSGSMAGDAMAFAVLEQILGPGPQIKWASNTANNMLNIAAGAKTDLPFSMQAFNATYTDSGLFGVSIVSVPENSDVVVRAAVEQLRQFAAKPATDLALKGAKNRVKSLLAFSAEASSDVVESRALELLNTGKVSDSGLAAQAVDKVTAADVQKAAKKITEKMTMVSLGEICNVPYMDQL